MLITAAMLLAVQSTNLVANKNSSEIAPATTTAATCWGSFSCGPATTILGYYVNIPDVRECARACNNNARCGHFTYFSVGMLEHVCFLFQACERRNYLCEGACTSGPRCSACAPCGAERPPGGDGDVEGRYGKRRLNILRATRK
jgi:hypothetical protein